MSNSNTERNISSVLSMLWFVAGAFSVIHVLLYGELKWLFFLFIIATLLAILVIFMISIIRKKSDYAKGYLPLLFILGIFIILISWLGMIRTYPEYKEISYFQAQRADLVYRISFRKIKSIFDDYSYQLNELYLKAPKSVERLQEGVNQKGAIMMQEYLEDRIQEGRGEEYADEMFELAEIGFLLGTEFAQRWYQEAYEHGRTDALKRYAERIALRNAARGL